MKDYKIQDVTFGHFSEVQTCKFIVLVLFPRFMIFLLSSSVPDLYN